MEEILTASSAYEDGRYTQKKRKIENSWIFDNSWTCPSGHIVCLKGHFLKDYRHQMLYTTVFEPLADKQTES